MKKLTTILFAVLLSSTVSMGQQAMNLVTTLTSPAAGAVIPSGQAFSITAVVKNAGTNPIAAGDTIGAAILINGERVTDQNNYTYTLYYKDGLAPNATQTFTFSGNQITLPPGSADTVPVNVCVVAGRFRSVFDSAKAISGSGRSCFSIKIVRKSGTAIQDATGPGSKHQVSGVYPNPANSIINLDLRMGEKDVVSIVITDMAGRSVLNENKGILSAGEHKLHVNTASLPSGIYMYDVIIGNEKSKGKFSINRN